MMMALRMILMKLQSLPEHTVIRNPENKGYGVAIRSLFQAAKEQNADIMVTLDSDGQHNPDQIPQLIEPFLKQGFDIVIGSRFLKER